MAKAFQRGIGKSPPNPERLRQSLISGGKADGGGVFASTLKDEEEIFQYLREMPRPFTL